MEKQSTCARLPSEGGSGFEQSEKSGGGNSLSTVHSSGNTAGTIRGVFFILLFYLFPLQSPQAEEPPILIFAAASLREVVENTAAQFSQQTGLTVTGVYGSSGMLARQVAHGAPADMYLSANLLWLDWLRKEDGDNIRQTAPLAGNRLVLIQPRTAVTPLALDSTLPAQLGDGKLALGNVLHVPAGMYAKAALENLGLWAVLHPQLVQAPDVRRALALVEQGEAAGLVYESDALASSHVKIAATAPADRHPPIRYQVVLLQGGTAKPEQARAFYDFLLSPPARAILARHGFTLLDFHP